MKELKKILNNLIRQVSMSQSTTLLLRKIAQTIKLIRRKQQLSQEQLAQLADLDRTYISGIERGTRNLTINSLENIIRALNISHSEFFTQLIQEDSDEL